MGKKNKKSSITKAETVAPEETAAPEVTEGTGPAVSGRKLPRYLEDRRSLYVTFALAIAALLLYLRTTGFDFINLDDNHYIYENPVIPQGLTWESIKWAFTTFYFSNWHPLTWLSYLFDSSFLGPKPASFHLVNTIFHAANSALLFIVIRKLTDSVWKSAIVAAVFAFHPTHVESVAWISERKDALSTLFWFLATFFYIDYARNAGTKTRNYLLTLLCFALGLMSKPMLVTMPFTFLLLDYWALERFDKFEPKKLWPLVKEKLLFFALTVISSAVAIMAQRTGGAIETINYLPIETRIFNTFVSYAKYTLMFFYPANLGVWYPYDKELPVGLIAVSIAAVLAISAYCIWQIRDKKYLFVGWFWFLGTLIPVIGLLQVGGQALADRYTYVPYVGLSIAVVWLAADWLKSLDRRISFAAAGIALLVFAGLTWRQIGFWQNSETLFWQTISVSKNNFLIEQNLCHYYIGQNRLNEAETLCKQSLEHNENYVNAYISLGIIYFSQNKATEAAQHFRKGLELEPSNFGAFSNLTKAIIKQGNYEDAAQMTGKMLEIQGANPTTREIARQNFVALGFGYAEKRDFNKSAEFLTKALELNPRDSDLVANLGYITFNAGKKEEGKKLIQESLAQNPNKAETNNMMGVILLAEGEMPEAARHFEQALKINPDYQPAKDNLAKAKGRAQ